MAVVQKRYDALDQEYDVATSSISSSTPTDILNTGYNSVASVTAALSSLVSSASGSLDASSLLKSVSTGSSSLRSSLGLDSLSKDVTSVSTTDLLREVQGVYKSTIDLSQLSDKDVERYIASIFSDDVKVQNLFKKLAADCRNSSLSNATIGNPFKKTSGCSGRSNSTTGSCDPGAISDILQQATGVESEAVASDFNKLLRKFVTLGNLGYSANACMVLNRLLRSMDADTLKTIGQRVAAIVLLDQATEGNTNAFIDGAGVITGSTLAASDFTAFIGSPVTDAPTLLSEASTNFTIPSGLRDLDLVTLGGNYTTALSTYDSDWMTDDTTDGLLSVAQLGTTTNSDLSDVLSTVRLNNIFDEDSLDTTFTTDFDIVSSAYSVGNATGLSLLDSYSAA